MELNLLNDAETELLRSMIAGNKHRYLWTQVA